MRPRLTSFGVVFYQTNSLVRRGREAVSQLLIQVVYQVKSIYNSRRNYSPRPSLEASLHIPTIPHTNKTSRPTKSYSSKHDNSYFLP